MPAPRDHKVVMKNRQILYPVCLALVLLCIGGCADKAPPASPAAPAPAARGDILIDEKDVYPESVTSTADGAVISGSMKGILFRAGPQETVATAWIHPTGENGLLAAFGVLAHDPSNTLWVCSVPNPFQRPAGEQAKPAPSSLVAFDLRDGTHKGTYQFPVPGGVCNDIAVAADGTVYATDTPGGRILRLTPGASELTVWGEHEQLKGIDGIAFSEEGVMYVNIVTTGKLLRVATNPDGSMGAITELTLSQPISGPDGMRPMSGNRFLLAEGPAGRISEVTIEGDAANIRVLREGLNGSPGVTLVGDTAYAIEGKIGYLIDPKLKGQDPGAFTIYAIPVN